MHLGLCALQRETDSKVHGLFHYNPTVSNPRS